MHRSGALYRIYKAADLNMKGKGKMGVSAKGKDKADMPPPPYSENSELCAATSELSSPNLNVYAQSSKGRGDRCLLIPYAAFVWSPSKRHTPPSLRLDQRILRLVFSLGLIFLARCPIRTAYHASMVTSAASWTPRGQALPVKTVLSSPYVARSATKMNGPMALMMMSPQEY